MRFFAVMLLVFLPVFAAGPQGGGPKNLKVLTPADLRAGVMNQYVQALGVVQSGGCNFCHVPGPDRSLDDNPKKLTARKMISMVKEINTTLGAEDGKPMVTCYTCHRGKTMPETAPPAAGQPLP